MNNTKRYHFYERLKCSAQNRKFPTQHNIVYSQSVTTDTQ